MIVSNQPNPNGDSSKLSPDEQRILGTLVDPDAPTAVNEDAVDYLLTAWIAQDQTVCQYCVDLGLKPKNFFAEAHRQLIRVAFAELNTTGGLPSQEFLRAACTNQLGDMEPKKRDWYLSLIDKCLVPVRPVDRPSVLRHAEQKTRHSIIKNAINTAIDGLKLGKFDASKLTEEIAKASAIGGTSGNTPKIVDIDEFFSEPDPVWLVDGQIQANSLCCVWGESNKGKTWFAQELSASLATGLSVFGDLPVKKQPILYVISEGKEGFKIRLKGWLKHHGFNTPEGLAIVKENFKLVADKFNLIADGEGQRLVNLVRAKYVDKLPGLIVLDTFFLNFGDGDEDESTDMRKVLNNLDDVRRGTGATVLAIHHTGKDVSRGERGSYALRTNCDTSIEISMKGSGAGSIINVKCHKQRNGQHFAKYHLQSISVEVTPNLTSLIWHTKSEKDVVAEETLDTRIKHELPGMPGPMAKESCCLTAKQVAELVGESEWTCRQALNRLAADDLSRVKRGRAGSANSPYFFWSEA